MTPKQLCEKIVAGLYKGGIAAEVLKDDAKKALGQK